MDLLLPAATSPSPSLNTVFAETGSQMPCTARMTHQTSPCGGEKDQALEAVHQW